MKKIYFTQLLAAILLLCGTLTANAEKVTGYAGLGVEWELDTESGELVFSGFGDMYLTNKVYSTIHFNEYKEQIKSVKIGRNIKSISPYLFDGLTNLESIDIPSSIEQIAEYIIDDARSTFIGTAWWNNQPDGLVYLEDWLIGYKGEKPAGEITIKDGTKGICQRAFSRCEEITKVILPSSVQYIRHSAFEGCTSLTDINLPEGLLYINDRAFGNCSSLANISIPSSVIHISIDVFDGTAWHNSQPDGLIYIDNWFYGFKGEAPAGELVIADETKGIAGGALRGCKELTTVSLPAGLKSIGSFAFEECGFETITVPNGVLHIGRYAFQSCVNLKEFAFSHWIIAIETIEQNILSGCNNLESIGETAGAYIFEDNCIYTSEYHHEHSENILLTACGTQIPQTIDYIDSYAFYGNEKVTEIVVPEGVKSIGEMAFGYCPNLTSITLPASITHTGAYITNGNKADVHISDLQAWCNIEFATPESNPLYDASNLYLNGELVTDLVIPAGITEIKKSTFTGCNSITSVTIPQGVTSIGSYAFNDCSSLTSVTSLIPAENLFAIDSNTFQNVDKNACTLYVPAGAKETYAATEGWSVFTNIVEIPYGKCGDNATWELADGVLTISGTGDMYDFSNAENIPWYDNKDEITSVITEDGITSIGDNAFYNCSNIQSLRIGVGVTRIGQFVLRNCNAITNIVIPASVVSINKWAFAYNGNISSIIIHSNNPVYDSRENCNAIIETATNTIQTGCTNTIIPSSVTTIGNGSFAGCTRLTSINIPEGVETIEANAFRDCSNLEEISIPSTVTNIKDWAFENCANLTTAHISSISDWCKINFKEINYFRPNIYVNDTLVTSIEIPEDITEIKQSTFSYLAGISSVTIHSNVTSISHLAFYNYNNLTSLISLIPAENLYEVYSSTFDYLNNSGCTLYVPAGAKETYAATEGWNRFTNIVEIPYGKCGDNATWKLADGVLTISGTGDMYDYDYNDTPWYDYNPEITSVVIESGITSIGNRAFSGCSGHTSITIPESVTSIGEGAFYKCSSLTSIEIPNSVTSIGKYAFNYCYVLTSIVVKEGNTVYDSRNNCNAVIETATNTLVIGCKNTIIPDGITSIGSNAFNSRYGLTSIEIPNSVTSIGYGAFYNCWNLTSIEIPNSVTSIGDEAFAYCSGLTSVTSLIPAENLFAINSNVFYFVNKSTLYVPAGAKETYAATEGWNRFTNIKEMIEEPFALTVSAAKYATLYLDYNATIPAGLRVYYAEKIEGETLLMERINDVIPANTGVIVTGAAGTYKFDKAFEEVAAIENNLFQGSVEDSYITPEKGTKYYVLSMVDGVVGMYLDELAGGTFKNNAHKAYLPLNGESLGIFDTTVNAPDVQLSNRYTFNFGGVTAVESITTTASDEAIYNLNGQRVENPTKGIYIRGGKKVVY